MTRSSEQALNILLVGEEAAGVNVLRWLGGTEHRIVAVLAGRPPGHARTATVASTAARLGLSVRDPALVATASFAGYLEREGVDLMINVHSLVVAHPDVVTAPRIGSFNLHPGPLPQYAGLNVPSWAILNGEREHAATLHWMAAGIDTGAIAYTAGFPIAPDDTGLSLSAKCVRHGVPLLHRLVHTAATEPAAIPSHAQDPGRRRYFGREAPYGGSVPWALPAQRLLNLIRAADYGPFPSPWGDPVARLRDLEIGFVRATGTGNPCSADPGTVGPARGEAVRVAAAGEWILVERVRVEGKIVAPAAVMREGERLFDAGARVG